MAQPVQVKKRGDWLAGEGYPCVKLGRLEYDFTGAVSNPVDRAH